MARRSGRTSLANSVHFSTPEQSTSLPQPPCLSEDLRLLRTHWKWAAFGQFITTFSPMLNIPDVTINDVENDLVNDTRKVIPRVVQRLLYTLTYDRKINADNWQSALRRQYMKRDPTANPLGPEPPKERRTESREPTPEAVETEVDQRRLEQVGQSVGERQLQAGPSTTVSETSRAATQDIEDGSKYDGNQVSADWFALSVLAKLESLHLLTEWQFQNATRLRTLMRSDDEFATWRHEPIGYDSKRNAYWLIGGDRLWIQRVRPKPARTLKRKRPTQARKSKSAQIAKSKPTKRQRTNANAVKEDQPKTTGLGRAAKLQAKIRLDAQAKELAALNQQARGGRQSARLAKPPVKPPPGPLGTRVNEWLNDSDARPDSRATTKAADGQDNSSSDLTELSDNSEDSDAQNDGSKVAEEQDVESSAEEEKEKDAPKNEYVEPLLGDDFVEWETICVTLEEWERIAERFEKANHYLEKALYKYLTNEIVPGIVEVLREAEKKKRLEDALVHRKRSSRIAMKESEREEARLVKLREAEEAEKMSRARRLEARRQREEEERLKREQAREQRRKEREARELRRQAEMEQQNESNEEESEQPANNPPPPSKPATTNGVTPKPSVKTKDWELDCEICHKRGVNLDDRTPMMSCGKCYKWQHIACHDQADERAGRSKRNWNVVEFICQQCRSRMFAGSEGANSYRDPRYFPHVPQGVNLSSPYHHAGSRAPNMSDHYRTPTITNPGKEDSVRAPSPDLPIRINSSTHTINMLEHNTRHTATFDQAQLGDPHFPLQPNQSGI
ncbi:hypothetical protein AN958_12307 [Leucoagaricus sp. SymC.cos]|nr:hypothetical protein AN958_12307 [Leucoagaricus sp. SymC.cos]